MKTDENREKLKALVTLFDLSLADLARTARVSPALICRIMHDDIGVRGDAIFPRLESSLVDLIGKRRKAYFTVEAVPVETVRVALTTVTAQRRDAA